MKPPSIRVALTSMRSMIVVAIVALSFTSYSSLDKLHANTEDVGEYWMSRMVLAREIKGNFNLMRLAYARVIMASTPNEVASEIANADETATLVTAAVAEYEAGIRTNVGRTLIDSFKPEFEAYRMLGNELIGIKQDGQTLVATSLFKGKMKEQSEPRRVCRRPSRLSYAAMAGASRLA